MIIIKIGFIGIGNMGGAILKGYLKKSENDEDEIFAYDIDDAKTGAVKGTKGLIVCGEVNELVIKSDIIIVGVKPNAFDAVMPLIAESYDDSKVLISMAAGITIQFIENYIGKTAKIIRIMPNTPALVGEGMTSASRNGNITDDDMRRAFIILETCGKACEVPEELIHCVIGVSGSCPAYTYMYIDGLAEAAVKNGMDKGQALYFAAQTVLGAAKMVLETGIDPVQLRINVCSPGGTTIEAVQKLQEMKFAEVIEAGFQAAVDKSMLMSGQ